MAILDVVPAARGDAPLFAAAAGVLVPVEGELGADGVDSGWLGAEDDIDEVGALEVAGLVGEFAFFKALDLLYGGSGGLDRFFEALDGFFDGFFFSARVEGEECFVSVHGSWFLWLN